MHPLRDDESILFHNIIVSNFSFSKPSESLQTCISLVVSFVSSACVYEILCNKLNSACVSLVAIYNQLGDRCINDVTVNFFSSLLYKTKRFHVAMCLFSNRSKMASKYGKKVSDTLA